MRTAATLGTIVIVLAGCHAGEPSSRTAMAGETAAWSESFAPPSHLDTERVRLEPLTPAHAELDHEAFMSSREHLQRTLHWGSWPRPDATVQENREDLARHEREFLAREAYAYTVLRPDGTACLGCVYLSPVDGDPATVSLAWWVTEAGVRSGLDEHLFAAVRDWLDESWPFDVVVVELHVENVRGIAIAEDAGLERTGGAPENHVRLVWRGAAAP